MTEPMVVPRDAWGSIPIPLCIIEGDEEGIARWRLECEAYEEESARECRKLVDRLYGVRHD